MMKPPLTPDSVRQRGVRRLASFYLPGDARGLEAQPLVAAGVKMPGGETRDLLICATMSNRVFAFDIGSLDDAPVWSQYLGMPVKGSKAIDQYEINDNWGILSTPVIEVERDTLYCVAWVSPDRTVARAGHLVFALDLRDGHVLHPPLGSEDATYSPAVGFRCSASSRRAEAARRASVHGRARPPDPVHPRRLQSSRGRRHQSRLAHRDRRRGVADRRCLDVHRERKRRRHLAGGERARPPTTEGFIYLMTGNGSFDPPHDLSQSPS